jgi:SRSO17 transposase
MLTSSPWDYIELFKSITNQCFKTLKSQKNPIFLLVDEVGFRKKGKRSACVGSQYLGSIGKNDNGQVAVTAALSSGTLYCPIGIELFMPKHWMKNLKDRLAAGIPKSKTSESKPTMALSIIQTIFKKRRADLECVVFDALYGSKMDLLHQLIKLKIPFVGDVKGRQSVYLSEPQMKIPRWSGRGRKFFKKRPSTNPILIERYVKTLKRKDFTLLKVRNGTKAIIQAQYHKRKVWILHEQTNTLMPMYVLIRKNADGEIKYCLASFNDQRVTLIRLAKAQAQRSFVERVFEEGKNIVGMGDYQTRSWDGFHRHMALCSLAMLFLMEQKILLQSFKVTITAYNLQALICTRIAVRNSIDQVIIKVLQEILQYQKQIQKHAKSVT